jgi:hypothetical protein
MLIVFAETLLRIALRIVLLAWRRTMTINNRHTQTMMRRAALRDE